MKASTVVEGRCYSAQSNPKHAHVWSVYDNDGRYVESFGGSIHAAQERIKALDFDELIRRRGSVTRGGMKQQKDRAAQPPGAAAAAAYRKDRVMKED